ncbi:hypothetical protein JCM3766R1_000422 [Sporobolomyces carnicolor]
MVPVLVQVVEKSGVFLAALIRPSEKQGGTRGGAGGAGVRDEDGALLMLFEVEASELPRAEVLIQFCSSGGTFGAPALGIGFVAEERSNRRDLKIEKTELNVALSKAVRAAALLELPNREVDAELVRRASEGDGPSKGAADILSAYKTRRLFGRAIVAKTLTPSQQADAPPPPKKVKQTMYKFNEGFSDAVRTTKRVADFFA